jgi:hypothetical protein
MVNDAYDSGEASSSVGRIAGALGEALLDDGDLSLLIEHAPAFPARFVLAMAPTEAAVPIGELSTTACALGGWSSVKLEAQLGVASLRRTTRSVRLTEAGERLYARLRPALVEVRTAVAAVGKPLRTRPRPRSEWFSILTGATDRRRKRPA